MIQRPSTEILHQYPIPLHVRSGRRIEVPMRTRRRAADTCARALSAQPHDDALPVVSVAQPIARLVFGPVPRVHDAEVAVGGAGPAVDLAGAAGALAGGGAGGVEAAARKGGK